MDHFTHCIIREELWAMTARPPPGVSQWTHSPANDHVFYNSILHKASHNVSMYDVDTLGSEKKGAGATGVCRPPIARTPSDWVQGGVGGIRDALKFE